MAGKYNEYGQLVDSKLREHRVKVSNAVRVAMQECIDELDSSEIKMYWLDLTNTIDCIMGSEVAGKELNMRRANSTISNANSREEGNRQG